jgi:UDP-3-O-[3-hydroxymyristoyl] N-acetylglucosamine deacetylase
MSDTILLVDDDASVRSSIGDVLRDEGFEVITASDGHEAVETIAREHPSLVLLDVWMPEMDGIEVLAQIKGSDAGLPVIVLSGHGNVEMAVRATRLGAADFIEKPFSIDGLLSSVRRALDATQIDAEPRAQTGSKSDGPVAACDAPRVPQRTLARSVVGGGLGLHSGVRTGLILHPMPVASGIRFARVGSEGYVEAHVDNVDSTGYATTLYKQGMVARTIEHLMATLHAYGVTNLLVKMEGEVPILDGSAVELCELVESVGIEEQAEPMPVLVIREPIRLDFDADQFISIVPHEGFRVTYELSYAKPVGEQSYTFELSGAKAFREQIAPARTFGFVDEIRQLEAAGLGQGGQLGNFILIGDQGIVNTELRFPEELARHKILDLIGDAYLLGRPIWGAIHARKTGHSHNIELLRAIRDRFGA